MADVILSGIIGIAFSTLQLLLMRRVLQARSGVMRALLLVLKMPLWAAAFIGIALWWGAGPLIAFGIAAGATYLIVAIIYYIRTRPVHEKGE